MKVKLINWSIEGVGQEVTRQFTTGMKSVGKKKVGRRKYRPSEVGDVKKGVVHS